MAVINLYHLMIYIIFEHDTYGDNMIMIYNDTMYGDKTMNSIQMIHLLWYTTVMIMMILGECPWSSGRMLFPKCVKHKKNTWILKFHNVAPNDI